MNNADYVVIVRNLRDSLDPRTPFAHCPRCRRSIGPWEVLSRRYLASTLQSLITQCPCQATVEILPGIDEALQDHPPPPIKPWIPGRRPGQQEGPPELEGPFAV